MNRRVATLMTWASIGFLVGGCDGDDVSSPWNVFAEEAVSMEIEVTTQTSLWLQGINGNIEVEGVDNTPQVLVTGFRRVFSDTQEDAERRLEDLRVEKSLTDGTITITTVQPSDTEGRNYIVDYSVRAPRDLMLTLRNVNGNTILEDTVGDADLRTANGNVVAHDLEGNAVLTTVNGNVIVETLVSPGAEITMTAANGNLELGLPTDASVLVSASLGNGNIRIRSLVFLDLLQTARTLSGRLGAGEGSIELLTGNGNITITGR